MDADEENAILLKESFNFAKYLRKGEKNDIMFQTIDGDQGRKGYRYG